MLQGLYHAVSLVGTLLLQIGEVGQKFDKRRGSSQPPPEEPKERRPTVPESWSSLGSHFYQWNILVRVFSVPLFSIYCKNWSFNFFLRVLFWKIHLLPVPVFCKAFFHSYRCFLAGFSWCNIWRRKTMGEDKSNSHCVSSGSVLRVWSWDKTEYNLV